MGLPIVIMASRLPMPRATGMVRATAMEAMEAMAATATDGRVSLSVSGGDTPLRTFLIGLDRESRWQGREDVVRTIERARSSGSMASPFYDGFPLGRDRHLGVAFAMGSS